MIARRFLWFCAGALTAVAASQTPAPPLTINLQNALARARQYGGQIQSANLAALLAGEDRVQARAATLPSVNAFNQFIYTEPNGTPSGVFVANDGPHVYNDQLLVHGDVFNASKRADYRRLLAVEAVARAKGDLAARGLIATVTQNYYGLVVSQRK